MRQGIQQTVMEIMDGSPKHAISRYVEWLITVVVLVNCTAVILDSVPEIHAVYKDFFHELEFWSVIGCGHWALTQKAHRKVAVAISSVRLV
jgi:hypothetical protein